ncbi:MAG: hypothetical protein FWF06_00745 [Symbiobacteriaceae bacterium]|nr:hypothetical protein [Symbiobacteriaceae bacterium]
MSKPDIDDLLELYLSQQLSAQEKAALESHLLSSATSAAKLADLSLVRENLALLAENEIPAGLHAGIMQQVEQARRREGVGVTTSGVARRETGSAPRLAPVTPLPRGIPISYNEALPRKRQQAWRPLVAAAAILLVVFFAGQDYLPWNRSSLVSDAVEAPGVPVEVAQLRGVGTPSVGDLPSGERDFPEDNTMAQNTGRYNLGAVPSPDMLRWSTPALVFVQNAANLQGTTRATELAAREEELRGEPVATLEAEDEAEMDDEQRLSFGIQAAPETEAPTLSSQDQSYLNSGNRVTAPEFTARGESTLTGEPSDLATLAVPPAASPLPETSATGGTPQAVTGESSVTLVAPEDPGAAWVTETGSFTLETVYNLARDIGCLAKRDNNIVHVYGNPHQLQQLVKELYLKEPVAADPSNQARWVENVQQGEDTPQQLVINILP